MLRSSSYGKSRVRLVKVERHPDRHDFKDLNVHIQFTGEYDDCYVTGDNSRILPTDTMKNTVYALARRQPLGAIEEFGKRLCEHFRENNPHLTSVRVEIEEALWSRLGEYAFEKGSELRTATVIDGQTVYSGLKNLIILKTSDSSFSGYVKDRFTTLKETSDRLLGTAVEARWLYDSSKLGFDALWPSVRQRLVDVFMEHISPSAQSTLYAMGEAVLQNFSMIREISLSLPNKHCLLVNLEPFGMDNPNEVFLPVDEPHGLIEAVLTR